MKNNLSLCMIVRDNEDTIIPCLESIRPWVDEMIVVDTGSQDKTPKIAESLGAKLFYFDWIDDFSAARNISIGHASGDWVFWMDSDDTIPPECGQRLRNLANSQHDGNVLGYVVQVRCPSVDSQEFTVVDHIKLFRNREDLRFEGRIHEQVLMPIRRAGGEIGWSDIYVVHSGSKNTHEAQKVKSERDLRILHLDLSERPNHPFVLFNFAMTHAELGNYEEALVWIEKCLAVSKPQESHVAKTYSYKTNCLFQLCRVEEALSICQHGLMLYPNDVELLFRKGMILHKVQNYDDSVASYKKVLARQHLNERAFRSTDPGIEGYKCRYNLGVVYRDAGHLDEAEIQWRRVLTEKPNYRPAIRALGSLLLQNDRATTAEVFAEELMEYTATTRDAVVILCRVLEIRGDGKSAISLLERSVEQFPNDEPILEEYCKQLYGQQRWEESRVALHSVIDLNPENGRALHNLGAVYLEMGDRKIALQMLERSLNLRPSSWETKRLIAIAQQH